MTEVRRHLPRWVTDRQARDRWLHAQDPVIWMSYALQVFVLAISVIIGFMLYESIMGGHYTAAVFNFFMFIMNVYTFLSVYYTRRSYHRPLS